MACRLRLTAICSRGCSIRPTTYWDGASAFIRHAADVEGGFDKLKGKTIGLVHLDAPYGKEPIPLLEALAKDYGFTSSSIRFPARRCRTRASLWLDVRRDRPDWIYLQGWGAMNPTAIKEAAKISFPMNRLVGVWWSGNDDDARPAGEEAKGYSSLDLNAVGANFPAHPGHHQIRRGQGQEPSQPQG